MQRPRPQSNISTGSIPPPVGFQIMPASGGSSSNASSMRPTYAFLPVDQSDINQRMAADQVTWRNNNQSAFACEYPGIDLYGTGNHLGARNCTQEAGCKGGRVFKTSSSQCECPDGFWAETKGSDCRPNSDKDFKNWFKKP